MRTKRIIHLLSGGLDSTVMLYDLLDQGCHVHALLFDYGQKHAQELEFAKLHCRKTGVHFTRLTLPPLRGSVLTDGSGSVVVPGRNSIFLSTAVNLAVAAGSDTVTIGCNKSDAAMFPDCRKEFIDSFNEMVKASGLDVEICAPYLDKLKWEIGAIGREMAVNLMETWTCYEGGEKPCGKCSACVSRQSIQ